MRTAKPVLQLGDVAEISAADSQAAGKLAAVELIPSPPAGEKRYISLREIQDVLLLRGVNLAECQFSGAGHITVTAASAGDASQPKSGPVRSARSFATGSSRRPARVLVQQAQRLVDEAIVRRLQEDSKDSESWQVSADLDDSQVPTVVAAIDTIVADGSPAVAGTWIGRQEFDLTILTADGPAHQRSRGPHLTAAGDRRDGARCAEGKHCERVRRGAGAAQAGPIAGRGVPDHC